MEKAIQSTRQTNTYMSRLQHEMFLTIHNTSFLLFIIPSISHFILVNIGKLLPFSVIAVLVHQLAFVTLHSNSNLILFSILLLAVSHLLVYSLFLSHYSLIQMIYHIDLPPSSTIYHTLLFYHTLSRCSFMV